MQRKREKLDGLDAEEIAQTLGSHGFRLIHARLWRTLDVLLADLERHHSEVETATIRGTITGLRLALGIPDILMDEAKEGSKRDGQNKPHGD